MKTIHTPGPWKTEKDAYGRWSIDAQDGSDWIARTVPMCDLRTHMAMFDTEANARLIAASPTMLAVLQELEESAGYWSEYDVPLGIVDRIRQVIKDATGAPQ